MFVVMRRSLTDTYRAWDPLYFHRTGTARAAAVQASPKLVLPDLNRPHQQAYGRLVSMTHILGSSQAMLDSHRLVKVTLYDFGCTDSRANQGSVQPPTRVTAASGLPLLHLFAYGPMGSFWLPRIARVQWCSSKLPLPQPHHLCWLKGS